MIWGRTPKEGLLRSFPTQTNLGLHDASAGTKPRGASCLGKACRCHSLFVGKLSHHFATTLRRRRRTRKVVCRRPAHFAAIDAGIVAIDHGGSAWCYTRQVASFAFGQDTMALLRGLGAPNNSRASSTRRMQLSPGHGQIGGSTGRGPSAADSCSSGSRIDAAIIRARSAGTTLWSSCSCFAGPRPSRKCHSSYIQWRRKTSSSWDNFIRGCVFRISVIRKGQMGSRLQKAMLQRPIGQ
jgi:hypothetical protein